MAVKLTEQTNGPHIFMRLRLDSGRVEEIDAYISEEGWRYVMSIGFIPSGSRGICPMRSGSACSLPKQRCWRI